MTRAWLKRLSCDVGRLLITVTVVALTACRTEAPSRYSGTPVIVNDTLWQFPSGATAATYLRAEFLFIGLLTDTTGHAYLLASGVECTHCDAGLSVLLQAVGDIGTPPATPVPGWYTYPGELLEQTGMPSFRSRLFWGRCLPNRGPGLVQFATEFDSVGQQTRALVRLTEIRDGRLVDDSLPNAPSIDTTRTADGRRECREIPPQASDWVM